MKDLLTFLLKGITGKEIPVEETVEGERTSLYIKPPEDTMGIIIGKGGKTIRVIRNLVKVRATLEKKAVSITIPETK